MVNMSADRPMSVARLAGATLDQSDPEGEPR